MHCRRLGPSELQVPVPGFDALLRRDFDCIVADDDWVTLAQRFAAYAPGVDCVIVGGAGWQELI